MLVDPKPSQLHAGPQYSVLQPQQEVTRPTSTLPIFLPIQVLLCDLRITINERMMEQWLWLSW